MIMAATLVCVHQNTIYTW